jgi:hypothetical protein
VKDADDPRGALIVRTRQVETVDQLLVRGESGDRHRERVRDVRDQRSQRDHHLDAQHLGRVSDAVREGSPAEIGLRAGEQHKVALGARRSRREQDVARPLDLAGLALGQRDRRPVRLKVEELLGVDLGDHLGIERLGRRCQCGRRRAGCVIPAREGANQDRGSKARRLGLPGERVH